jgi:hypothetical protein
MEQAIEAVNLERKSKNKKSLGGNSGRLGREALGKRSRCQGFI